MSFSDWQTELQQSAHVLYRRLYIKRREAAGYEADWVEIPANRIKSWGTINHQLEYNDVIFTKSESTSVKLDNTGGYFNDITDSNSIFHGFMSRYKTLVKIEAGYKDSANADIGDPIIFMGIVLSNFAMTLSDITLKINPLVDVYKLLPVKDVSGLYPANPTLTSSLLLQILSRDATDGAGNIIMEPYVSSGMINLNHTSHILQHCNYTSIAGTTVWGVPTEANYGNAVFDLISKLTLVEDHVFGVQPNGEIIFTRRNKTGNLHSSETMPSGTPSELFMHTPFNGSPTSTVGPDWIWTGAAEYATVKHSEGAYYTAGGALFTGGAWPYVTVSSEYTTNAFNTEKFTIEFWLKTGYTVTNGDAAYPTYNPVCWRYWDIANNYNHLRIDYAPTIRLGKAGNLATSAACTADNISWEPGDPVFLAFVHDQDGIEGSADTMRIYFAPDGGDITLAASTATSKAPIMPTGEAIMNLFAGESTAVPGDAIDNFKIYNYAKTDFSDRNDPDMYMRPKFFDLVGEHDDATLKSNLTNKIRFGPNIEKVKNWIQIKYLSDDTTTSIAEEKESWTVGDSSSSDLYGQRKIETVNYYFDATTAAERATQLYNEFKEPKIEVNVEGAFMPFLKPLDHVKFTYQSPGTAKAIDFDAQEFSVQKITHDLNNLSSKIILHEV